MRDLVNRLTLFLLFGLLVVVSAQVAFVRATVSAEQSIQESRDARIVAGGEEDVRALEPDKPQRRELAGGRRHAYRVGLGADQLLKAIVEQDGLDVAVQVLDP